MSVLKQNKSEPEVIYKSINYRVVRIYVLRENDSSYFQGRYILQKRIMNSMNEETWNDCNDYENFFKDYWTNNDNENRRIRWIE